jgi:hypothetical protein
MIIRRECASRTREVEPYSEREEERIMQCPIFLNEDRTVRRLRRGPMDPNGPDFA